MLFCKSNNYSNFAFIKIISVIARMLKNSKKNKQTKIPPSLIKADI